MRRLVFAAKALIMGRTYYEDGTSERSSRRWVWKVYGPHTDLWPRRWRWLGQHDECGCTRWRVTNRPAICCMEHSAFGLLTRENTDG